MTVDDLRATFADHERMAPDPDEVMRGIRAELMHKRKSPAATFAPAMAVAIVLAVALAVVFTRSPGRHPSPPASSRPPVITADPEAVANASARAALNSVTLPPGARATDTSPAGLKFGIGTGLSADQAEASGVWLVPGTVSSVVAFARSHPAPGFITSCTCGGPSTKTISFLDEDADYNINREIDYVVAPNGSGVAIRITAIVPWVPNRPDWTYVDRSASSVDVTVQRIRQGGTTGGAPTIHRTLDAQETQRLVKIANSAASEAEYGCLGPFIRIAATDTLVFHEATRAITFTMVSDNCPQFRIDAPGHTPAYVDWKTLDSGLLRQLGLPDDYGR